jgi:hypothetical protein
MLLANDSAVTLARGNGSGDDPVQRGATLRVFSTAGDAFDDTYDLAASGWRYRKGAGANKGYKFRDATFKSVLVKQGRIRIEGKGALLSHSLQADPDPVSIVLALGEQRYCFAFGGNVTFKSGKKFLAENAPRAGGCEP